MYAAALVFITVLGFKSLTEDVSLYSIVWLVKVLY